MHAAYDPSAVLPSDCFYYSLVVLVNHYAMKPIYTPIRRIGKSKGFIVPEPILVRLGIDHGAEMSIEKDALVLRKSNKTIRKGWAAAARKLAKRRDDLPLNEFPNDGDKDLEW